MSGSSEMQIHRPGILASSKWLPIALIGLGAIIVIAAIAYPTLINASSLSVSAPIPSQLAGFSLASEATGRAAMQEFDQLHGKTFPILSGAKAVYGTGTQVIIWVAGTASVVETRKLLEEMRDKIAAGGSPFQASGVQTTASREVYALDGMGQKHFYFQSGKYLIWLAANAEVADQALQQALYFYP